MVKQPVSRSISPSLKVDKLLNNADTDLIRFAHVIRGWGGDFSDAIADSLSLIVLQGDVFIRSLTHIHAPRQGLVEIRNVYRPGYEGADITTIEPYASLELLEEPFVGTGRVAYEEALKRLQEHLRSLYGDVANIATPAFDVMTYLSRRGWWVHGYTYQNNSALIRFTDGGKCVIITINYTPMGLDKRAIAEYLKHRKDH